MSTVDNQPLQGAANPARDRSRRSFQGEETQERIKVNYGKELFAGLTVSFAALSLGVAFGDQSHRGSLKGVLSAGFIALFTSIVGGTLVQCSGPTAPMTAVTVTVMEWATQPNMTGNADDNPLTYGKWTEPSDAFASDFPGDDPLLWVNSVMLLTGLLMALMGVCQLGKLIVFVPNVVISGFMNGIAIMIWVPKVQELIGLGKPKMTGNTVINVVLALTTTFLIFNIPKVTGRFCAAYKAFLPATLIAILAITTLVTILVAAMGPGTLFDIQTVKTGDPIDSIEEVVSLFADNFPSQWSGGGIAKAIPFAIQLALLGYIDTLLTSRIVDAKVDEMFQPQDRWRPTNKNLELIGQACGNGFSALFGGIPGAQATIRSVLILNEGAMTRVAGLAAGSFTIIEILLFGSLVSKIPQCVLSGVMFKVGYDCFDWGPFLIYINTMILGKPHPGSVNPSRAGDPVVTHAAFAFIVVIAIANSFVPLHYTVVGGCIIYYVVDRLVMKVPDLEPYNAEEESEYQADAEAPRDAPISVISKSGAVERELSTASVGQQRPQ